MHGRIKVRTSEEQKLQKQKEQQKKLAAYRMGMKQILSTRNKDSYDSSSLALSAQLLAVNPDIYTLWNYRKEVTLMKIDESKKQEIDDDDEKLIEFCENELSLTQQCLQSNPKSYGSWHHRYWILNHHPKPNWQREFDLCNKYLSVDDRNFHCWDFRRLLVNKIGITITDEIKFSTERINVNFSNYSSWHYRSTLQELDQENVKTELTLVQNAIFTDPADTSAWFYLRWILSNPNVTKEQKKELFDALLQLQELEPDCKWVVMAKCWLTAASNCCGSDEDHVEYYKELIKLDPLRKGHYQHCLKNASVNS